jgi:hypothetical protein
MLIGVLGGGSGIALRILLYSLCWDNLIVMAMKSYQINAELLLKEYLLADPLIPYTSITGGIFACKMVCFN